MIVRCTAKLRAIVGQPDSQVVDQLADVDDWYANLLWIGRRKCLLVTHAGTLFSVFVPEVRAGMLRPLGPSLLPRIAEQLVAEGFPSHILGASADTTVHIANTADRSVLGCMNDLALLCEHAAARVGGLARLDLADLHRTMQRNISSARGYVPAIDLVSARADYPSRQDLPS